jgi:glutathione peroxidase-family protein
MNISLSMRYFFLIGLVLFSFQLKASTIQGQLNPKFKGTIFYLYGDNLDSLTFIVDDKGFFSGTLALTEPDIFYLIEKKNHKLILKLAIDPADNIVIDFSNGMTVKGSEETRKLFLYEEQKKLIYKRRTDLVFNYFDPTIDMADSLKSKYLDALDSVNYESSKELNAWVITEPGFIGSIASGQHAFLCNPDYEILLMDTILYYLKKDYPGSPLTGRLENKINNSKKLSFGAIAPDFVIKQSKGKKIKLHNVKSNYILLYFWDSNCYECAKQKTELLKTYHLYKEKGLTIIGIAMEYDKKTWIQAIKSNQYEWTNVSELKAWKTLTNIDYSVYRSPYYCLLDKDYKIIAKEKEIRKLTKFLSNSIR